MPLAKALHRCSTETFFALLSRFCARFDLPPFVPPSVPEPSEAGGFGSLGIGGNGRRNSRFTGALPHASIVSRLGGSHAVPSGFVNASVVAIFGFFRMLEFLPRRSEEPESYAGGGVKAGGRVRARASVRYR